MAIYHIKKSENQVQQPQPEEQEYWRQISPEDMRELDPEEIAALNNKYEGEDTTIDDSVELGQPPEQRIAPTWLKFLAPIALILVIALFLFYSSLGSQLNWGALSTSHRLAQDEALAALREAVVTIDSADSSGTGFNIAIDGLIVTNRHVVEDKNSVIIRFNLAHQPTFPASNWFESDQVDLAVIDIGGTDLPYLTLSTTAPSAGDDIIFIGNPQSFDWVISEGKVLGSLLIGEVPMLLIEGPVNPGSSGSPVFNDQHEVIGIIYAKLTNTENQGLAIPVSYLTTFLEEIYEQ